MAEKRFLVSGISCQHCVANVKRALGSLKGVSSLKVLQNEQLLIIHADPMPSVETLNELLSPGGHYKIKEEVQ